MSGFIVLRHLDGREFSRHLRSADCGHDWSAIAASVRYEHKRDEWAEVDCIETCSGNVILLDGEPVATCAFEPSCN